MSFAFVLSEKMLMAKISQNTTAQDTSAQDNTEPPSSEPQSSEPQSAEPQSAEPQSAEPQSAELTSTRRVRLLLSYDGTPFNGWQRQPSGKPTVQGELERALSQILDEPITVHGSGRTDAGAHALGQVAHFDTTKNPRNYSLRHALESLTPSEIAIRQTLLAPKDFHSRASATSKTYRYLILNRTVPSPFRHNHTFWCQRPLKLKTLNELSRPLLGEKDFRCFQSVGTPVATTVRTIHQAEWVQLSGGLLEFTITGTGFLKQMVRNIVGTIIDLYFQEASPDQMVELLLSKNRTLAGTTAPSKGLYLHQVYYPKILDNKCQRF